MNSASGWRSRWSVAAMGVLLLAGLLRVIIQFETYHPGDMNRLVAIADEVLGPDPLAYYHNHFADRWVYNHLAFFPLLMAPLVDLFNVALHINTAWAAKLLIGTAELAVGIVLYRTAGEERRYWGLAAAAAWLLAPWAIGGDHPVPVAVLFLLLALCNTKRGWLCGLLLVMGIGTRNEVLFFGLPLALHFVTERRWRDLMAFAGVTGIAIAAMVLPFLLYDPIAFDYGVRRQLQRDASDMISTVAFGLLPWLDSRQAIFIQENPTMIAAGMNLLLSMLALRDRCIARVALVVAFGYVLTLPLVHERYLLFTYGLALFYVGRYGGNLAATAGLLGTVVILMVPGGLYKDYLVMGLFVVLLVTSIIRPSRGNDGRPEGLTAHSPVPSSRHTAASAISAAGIILVVFLINSGTLPVPLPTPTWHHARFINLLGRLNAGDVQVVAPAGAAPESHVHSSSFKIDGSGREVIYMHPTSAAVWRVDVPLGTRLRFAMALDPQVWDKPGDGVDFEVEIRKGDEAEKVYSAYVDPKKDPAHRKWVEASVDLSRYGGQVVELVLRTLPHSSPDNDWAGWAQPVIRP